MFLGASRSATIIRSAAYHLRGMWVGLSELPAFEEQGGWRPGESLATRATSYPSSLVLIRPSGCERRSRARLIRANGTPVTGAGCGGVSSYMWKPSRRSDACRFRMRTEGVCREPPKHNVGMVWHDGSAHWPWGPTDNNNGRGMAAGIYCLMRILGGVRHLRCGSPSCLSVCVT